METDKNITSPENIGITENVFEIKNTFANHGNEIEEIISNKSPLLVRWGTVYFFVLLLMVGLICWFIQYPDIVIASAKLNSVNAPKQVVTRTDGKLTRITVKEDEKVEAGEVLGYMESRANPISVQEVNLQIDSISYFIDQRRTDEIIKLFPDYNTNQEFISNLGELQESYQIFIQSFITFRDFLSSGFFLRKKKMLIKLLYWITEKLLKKEHIRSLRCKRENIMN